MCQRRGHLLTCADQVRGVLGRERDQDRETEPAADLAGGVHETRCEPRLALLRALGRDDRRGHDRHRDARGGEQPGDHHVDDRAAARADPREQQEA